jgi:hypothetical protein
VTTAENATRTLGDRASLEEKIAKLTEQLDAESAARLFAEGAPRSARQERSSRRQEGYDVAAEAPSAETESADSKVTLTAWREAVTAARNPQSENFRALHSTT